MRVKLLISSTAEIYNAIWTAPTLLCIFASERFIRFWDIEQDTHYRLPLHDSIDVGCSTTASYSEEKQILSVGTESGQVVMFRYNGTVAAMKSLSISSHSHSAKQLEENPSEDDWVSLPLLQVGQAPVRRIHWGSKKLLAIGFEKGEAVSILNETKFHRKLTTIQFDEGDRKRLSSEAKIGEIIKSKIDVAVIQLSAQELRIERQIDGGIVMFKFEITR